MRMTVETEQLLQDGGVPKYVYHNRTAWRCAVFVGKKGMAQRISANECCSCTVNIACHVKQSIIGCRSSRKGEQVSKTNIESVGSVHVVPTITTRILSRSFPGTCETVGQVFKFVWRLLWKINVVCMSLSPFVSFQSRFVTYLLTFIRIKFFWYKLIVPHHYQKFHLKMIVSKTYNVVMLVVVDLIDASFICVHF